MSLAALPVPPAQVKAVRAFNRFYTRHSGVLDPYLGGELSLTETRVLYELAHRDQPTAGEIARDLSLDAGYLSRMLRRFAERGWIERVPSPADARQQLLRLSDAGHAAFAPLQQRSRDEAAALLARLDAPARDELLRAFASVQRLLSSEAPPRTAVLRELRPGDMGWVVQMHAEIYAHEYGWNAEFEALVADIAAGLLRRPPDAGERGWIAELDGERVGAIFLVRKSRYVAQLRLLILSPAARGLGLGGRLTDECLAFARAQGYRRVLLWTHSCLTAARSLYAKRGFHLTGTETYHRFGHDLVGETWELVLERGR